MVIDLYKIFLAGYNAIFSVRPITVSSNTMKAPWILYDNSRGHMSKSTVIDTFWHIYKIMAILAALVTELMLEAVLNKSQNIMVWSAEESLLSTCIRN